MHRQHHLHLPMPLRLQAEAEGGVTLHRGPLLLALPIESERRVVRGTPPFADDLGKLIRGELRRRTAKSAPSTRS